MDNLIVKFPERHLSKFNIQTDEEMRLEQFRLFQTDASVTVITAMADILSSHVMRTISMINLSRKSEYRGKYGILRDYSKASPYITNTTEEIRRLLDRYASYIDSIVRLLSRYSSVVTKFGEIDDVGTSFVSRIDVAGDDFSRYTDDIRRSVTDVFRPYKCSDPVMFYQVMTSAYLALRHEAFCKYIRSFAAGFEPGGSFSILLRLSLYASMAKLAHRCGFKDKAGRDLVLLFTQQEVDDWQKLTAKKSWQLKHRDNMPVVINVMDKFHEDAIVRPSFKLEAYMMSLETIDRIVLASEGHDPMYRKDYRMKRLQSCANSFEQAMLHNCIYAHRWSDLPRRMRDFIDSLKRRSCIDARRPPKPVVGFKLVPKKVNGKYVIDKATGRPDYYADFMGVWHSSYEAESEMSVGWRAIRRSVQLKAVNDGQNHVWVSLDDYLSMVYNSLKEEHPEIADDFLRMVPECQVRTSRQIAEGTKAAQGSLSDCYV